MDPAEQAAFGQRISDAARELANVTIAAFKEGAGVHPATVVAGCAPDNTIQAMFVTRNFNNAINGATLQTYLNNGGIVLTDAVQDLGAQHMVDRPCRQGEAAAALGRRRDGLN